MLRTVGDDHEPRSFSTYRACAIALIGKLPDTLHDRSVEIALKRRLPSEAITPLRLDRVDAPRRACAEDRALGRGPCPRDRRDGPGNAGGHLNRAADNWRPCSRSPTLPAAIGRSGPARPQTLTKAAEEGSRLESCLATSGRCSPTGCRRLPSADLVKGLAAMEGHPWAEYGRAGKPLTQNQLARALKPVGISPGSIWIGDESSRGYHLNQFEDAFSRYFRGSQTVTVYKCRWTGTSDPFQTVTDDPMLRFENARSPITTGFVTV